MGNEQWAMSNGQWAMGNGQWPASQPGARDVIAVLQTFEASEANGCRFEVFHL
jgi:hypothetical protein